MLRRGREEQGGLPEAKKKEALGASQESFCWQSVVDTFCDGKGGRIFTIDKYGLMLQSCTKPIICNSSNYKTFEDKERQSSYFELKYRKKCPVLCCSGQETWLGKKMDFSDAG